MGKAIQQMRRCSRGRWPRPSRTGVRRQRTQLQ